MQNIYRTRWKIHENRITPTRTSLQILNDFPFGQPEFLFCMCVDNLKNLKMAEIFQDGRRLFTNLRTSLLWVGTTPLLLWSIITALLGSPLHHTGHTDNKALQALEKQDIHVPKTPLKWQLIATSGVNKILVVLNRVPAVLYILHHVCNYFVLENHAAKLRKSSRKTSNI